jgi:hypothetical protein
MKNTAPTIELSPDAYMKIIAGKPIEAPATSLMLGKQYKLVNAATKTHMFRCLDLVLGDLSYWK